MTFHFRLVSLSITQRRHAAYNSRAFSILPRLNSTVQRMWCVHLMGLPTTSISPAATDVANDGASADTSHIYLPLTFGVTFSITK